MKIVNFHTYYDPTGRQLTELRLHMYKDIVDEFIICETNVTHSGLPARQGLDSLLQEVNLPGVKVRKIALNIPDVPELDNLIIESDYLNSYEGNAAYINSVRGRARERMQRDSLYSVLDDYDEDTFFIINDQDEFIDPRWIHWAVDTVEKYPQYIVKIPLRILRRSRRPESVLPWRTRSSEGMGLRDVHRQEAAFETSLGVGIQVKRSWTLPYCQSESRR